jgi:ABC-type branched-subunit amino acid transport system substrate-binding protein
LVALASIALLAAACGDDDSTSSDADAPNTTAATTPDGGSTPEDGAGSGGSGASLNSSTESEESVAALNEQLLEIFGEFPKVEGNTTRGVTEDSINLGVVGDFTFGGQPAFSGLCEGTKARAEKANEEGGLTHKINVVGCDDMSGDPNRTTLVFNDYVKDKEAFALIAQSVLPFPTNILEQEHVPHFGWGFNLSWCGQDNLFAFGTTGAANCNAVDEETNGEKVIVNQVIEGLIFEALVQDGVVDSPADIKLAIIGEDSATAAESVANEKRNAERAGATVVYAETPVPLAAATADYTPYVQQIMSEDANAVFSLLSLGTQTPFILALKQAGYEGVIYQTTAAAEAYLQIPAVGPTLDGVYAMTVGHGNPAGTSAEWQEVQAAAESQGVPVNSGFLHGYFGTELFALALADLEASGEDITTENLVNMMNGGWSYEGFGDVFNGTNWPTDHYTGTSCSGVSKFDADAKKLVEVLPLSCGGREIADK